MGNIPFGEYLAKYRRETLGLRQPELAEKLQIVSRSFLAQVELSMRAPTFTLLYLLRKNFGMSVDDFLDQVSLAPNSSI